MGLLDSIIGAVGQAPGAGGGQPDLLNAVIGLLGRGGGAGGGGTLGGLAGLVDKFHQGGLGNIVNSWVSSGQNLPISADQITHVLGSGTIGQLAQQLGLGHGDVAGQLSQLLPQVVDKLTPGGQLPPVGQDGGLGGLGDLGNLLGGLLKR
jgi:uncharacterized protein YidB (DUF937 family)